MINGNNNSNNDDHDDNMKIIILINKHDEGLHELTTKSKSVCNSFQKFHLRESQITVYQVFQSPLLIRITFSFWRISPAYIKCMFNFNQSLFLF